MSTVSPRRTIFNNISLTVEQSGEEPQLFPLGVRRYGLKRLRLRTLCPHDVVGLCAHKGTMWMSNDRVPLKNFESPYGGGVSSLAGVAGDPPLVMFPVRTRLSLCYTEPALADGHI